ncbi:MAG: trifunctional serine/threonine-protein kinase/ATP-binding protein/sensor histidine kinase [Leptolyngbya sp. Prado105]|jgi:predicted ATPase/signal transduction histidine kinase|nr:trifunctional serine/threonine-protein kinase/ATP-binding protein/sensor histidine kinase [Leptolyngbya sp. Prado105]
MIPLANTVSHPLLHIAGYTIVEQLYLGSRTAVYRAVPTNSSRVVVIKVLRREYPNFGELVQFRNQYTIAKNLPIPGLVKPLSLEPLGSGYALVMEDCGGISLEQYVQQQSLDLTQVLAIALQIADILHDLHQHQVVHKDIKPANILIHPESQQVKLIDFSIASLLPKETQEIQSPNILEGTLAYLAPEQTGRMNRGIDYRADFYALGVTLYQLLTGTLPFTSTDPLELVHCHIAKVPVPIDQVKADIPGMVAAIVSKLMAKNAEDRYQSARGLKHDLEQCLIQWKETGEIARFELGQRDLSDRFLIPEKLYGREAEVQTLLDAFDRVATGASELMLVAGFSGIGKTAVVNEVHKPITRQQGYFIKGKFDQFNRNIPLSAFVQALRDLMGQLLSESDDHLAQWQAKILAAVGENGQVLIDVIPELEQIIGKQPIAAELSGSAAQNRFNLLFQKFVEIFTTAEHPLVLFLDDLQWADLASLQLIKLLMNDNGYLLILGAYRDNEVSPAHPFILTVEELKKAQAISLQERCANVNTITLAPLALSDTNYLIADTLNCSRELAQPLTELIDRKTQGNPFFTTQFLKALHEENHITFNSDRRYWECDIAQVNALALTDDVVEFMALQLQKLPDETQHVLKLAACVGNQFDLATLAIVSEQSPTDTAAALWKALQEGLILPTSQSYKFFQSEDGESPDRQNNVNPTYRFLHDRIQQAAYSLIPEDKKQATHHKIGQLLLDKTSSGDREEKIFEIVNQLNQGLELITQPGKRHQLAQLNLQAGRKAKISTAYASAAKYLMVGIELLSRDSWQNQYDLTLALYIEAVAAEYLNTNFQQSEMLGEIILQRAYTLLDKVKVYELKIQSNLARNQLIDAIDTALPILEMLGCSLSTASSSNFSAINLPSLQTLNNFPEMTDPYQLAALRILNSIGAAVVNAKPEMFPSFAQTLVNICIQYGHSSLAAPSYNWYAIFLCVIDDIDNGYHSAQIALALLERYNSQEFKTIVYTLNNYFVRHRKEHVKETLPAFMIGLENGIENGDLVYSSFCALNFCTHCFYLGYPLEAVQENQEKHNKFLLKNKQDYPIYAINIYKQLVLSLLGKLTNDFSLIGEKFDEAAKLMKLEETQIPSLLFMVYQAKLILFYLFAEPNQAIINARLSSQHIGSVSSWLVEIEHYFYYSLALLADFSTTDSQTKQQYLTEVIWNQKKLEHSAHHAPMNHQHKYDLVAAEHHRVLGEKLEAIALYDRAIAGAKANGYIQEEALANELAAKFYLNWGKEKIAQDYLTNAYYAYAHWGAKAKVQDLEQRYPELLAPILQQQRAALSATETIFATTVLATVHTPGTQASSSGSTSISATLDLEAVLKASQALSSEIQLDKLLATLLHTVLENAGADKGALLMPHDQQWFVEAIATIHQTAQVQSVALSDSLELPHSLIHSVKRSLQPVVIVDATAHPTLATDPYVVKQQPKSLLCTPIVQQGKLVAILYLENQVTVGAFTSDRVELLNFLCAQAAISLENARLYQQAQTYAQQLEQSQLQIVQSEKMASLGNLVAGVAHEINNPIGFLNGSINNAKDYVKDLLDYLALYQQHHPNAAAPVQDKADEIDLEFLSEDLPKLLNSMKGATDRIKGISTSLRTFSRADTDHKVTANLHDGIDSTLLILKYRLKANEFRPAIEVLKDYGELPPVDCFPGQLNQVFMNILANAIDMFDEIAQQSSLAELKANPQIITIQTILVSEQNTVEIRIRDNGKGMTEEVKAKIFDHLFTTKGVGKGTGLGLAIARQIVVEKHGGSLGVQSEVGQVTEFCIRLPIDVE